VPATQLALQQSPETEHSAPGAPHDGKQAPLCSASRGPALAVPQTPSPLPSAAVTRNQ
jgi:hypothetical protein